MDSLPQEENQEPFLTEQEKQFIAQYNRLWAPVYKQLRSLVEGSIRPEDSSEVKLQHLKTTTESALQQAIQGRKGAEIELMQEVEKIVNRSGLTWERVQELIERAGYPFLKKYFENECDGRPTRELALENINRLLSFVENAHKSPFERDCNG
jgi:hypothetical protein